MIYIGYDAREQAAYDVAVRSLHRHASYGACPDVTALDAGRLRDSGLLTRPTDTRGSRYDIISNAPMSTDFAISRFLVPMLAQDGWHLFVDCDVVFMADVADLFALADPNFAVMCVKHDFAALTGTKMDGQAQVPYPRKLWSSVMLWNCNHPANKRLSLRDVNERPGRDLHAMYWLNDCEIGSLPHEWNWLVGLQPRPADAKLAHFTLGTPDLPGVAPLEEHIVWWTAHGNGGDKIGAKYGT